ncbi:16S rRNA (cytosine(1402)-N(4))-methyltransferase, partial [Streptococcus pyogenes]
ELKPKEELVSRKPILPSAEELEANNRSHSAKLRVARKINKKEEKHGRKNRKNKPVIANEV